MFLFSVSYFETDVKNLLIYVVLYLCCLEIEVLGIQDIHPYFFGASQKLQHQDTKITWFVTETVIKNTLKA